MLSRAEVPSSRIRIGRVLQEDPGQGDPLPLAAGEVLAALGDAGLVAAGHPHDLVVDAGHLGGLADLLRGGVLASRRRCSPRSCRRRRTGSGPRSRSAADRLARDAIPAARRRARQSPLVGGPAASGRAARSSCRSRTGPPRRSSRRAGSTIETPSSARPRLARSASDSRRSGPRRRTAGCAHGEPGLAGVGGLERAVDRLAQAGRTGRRPAGCSRGPRR